MGWALSRSRSMYLLSGALGAAFVGALAWQLRHADLARLLVSPGWIAIAALAMVVSLVAAVYNLSAFSARLLSVRDTLRAQLAVSALRVVAPSAVSTPVICSRYLVRCGMTRAESLAVVGTAQGAQLMMTAVVVAALGLLKTHTLSLPDLGHLAWYVAAAGAAAVILALVSWRVQAARRMVTAACRALGTVVTHLRRRPLRGLVGLAASAALTLAHVAAFACCVAAVGGHAPLVALCLVYVGAAGAGSLIPTPGGLGAVEAAMVAGLVAAGVDPPAAAAATLLTRLITTWALVPPGWLALRSLRRRALL